MKILISSFPFYPSIGGIEEVTSLLAHEFVASGHTVKVATMTPSSGVDAFPFEVIRVPSPRALLEAIRWCDVYLQNQISLRFAWPLLFIRRPWVVAHLHPLGGDSLLSRVRRWFKIAVMRRSHDVIACSRSLARQIGSKDVTVIPNPFRESVYRSFTEHRPNDLVFLGRLVSDKGIPVLLDALVLLRKRGLFPSLTIVGAGPDAAFLHDRCQGLGLTGAVRFAGQIPRDQVVATLNRSRIMVVPSIVAEGFGIVALEGIACGCVVVASDSGGLPEAVGPCGLIFPSGDAAALAMSLEKLLVDETAIASLRANAASHLERHRPARVASGYLEILEGVLRRHDRTRHHNLDI